MESTLDKDEKLNDLIGQLRDYCEENDLILFNAVVTNTPAEKSPDPSGVMLEALLRTIHIPDGTHSQVHSLLRGATECFEAKAEAVPTSVLNALLEAAGPKKVKEITENWKVQKQVERLMDGLTSGSKD